MPFAPNLTDLLLNDTMTNISVVSSPFFVILRWEAIWVQAVPPAIQGLLCHDQAPAHPQWRLTLPMHHLPGVLPQPVSHAEAHERPQARRHPSRLAHREDLPVPLLCLRWEEWMKRVGTGLGGKGNVMEQIGGIGLDDWGMSMARHSKARGFVFLFFFSSKGGNEWWG